MRRETVLRSWWASAAYFAASLFVGVCATGLALSLWPGASALSDVSFAALLVGPPVVVGIVLASRIAVRVEGEQVLVVNPFATHRIRRRDLGAVDEGRESYVVGGGRPVSTLQVHVRGGAPVQVLAAIRVTAAGRERAERVLTSLRTPHRR